MKKKIIVAEDDQDLRTMLVALLNKKGYDVVGLPNGIGIIEGHCEWPDLFILDKEMDCIDGVAITKFLRMHAIGKNIPIVMLSGNDNRKSAASAGVDFFVEKPFDLQGLITIIDTYLGAPTTELSKTA